MLFFSVGLPSCFGEWCDIVTAGLVERALGPVEIIAADTLDVFVPAVVNAKSPYVVVGSRQMVGRLWRVLADSTRRFVLALDDPAVAICNLVLRHKMDFREATRVVAKSCASTVSCLGIPGALVLRSDEAGSDPVSTVLMIARHLDLPISDADASNVAAAAAGFWPAPPYDRAWWDGLAEPLQALVAGAVDPYRACFDGDSLGAITWNRELFYIDEDPHEGRYRPASRPVDVTGPPRPLVYGPYVTLPPASWRATVALGFSEEAAETSYIVEVHAEGMGAHLRVEPGRQRFVEVTLSFTIDEPKMVAFQIQNERAAFDGRLALGHVILTPQTHLRSETRRYFASALGGVDVPSRDNTLKIETHNT